MKKSIASALCAALALSLSVAAFAAEPLLISPAPETEPQPGYTLQVDGQDIGVRACIMVPLRAVAEKLGFEVIWNGDGTIFLDDGTMHSTITLGEDLYQVTTSIEGMVGMSAPFSLGVPPYAVNGTTYVPLGLFDALLGSQQGAVTMEDGMLCLNTDPLARNEVAQLPNPFVDCDTLGEAIEIAGFNLAIPNVIDKSTDRLYRVMALDDRMLEVIYLSGEDEVARIRKAPGTEDISGDYTTYAQMETASVSGAQVILKGDAGKVSLAIWTVEEYTYSVHVEDGISAADMTRLVSNIR